MPKKLRRHQLATCKRAAKLARSARTLRQNPKTVLVAVPGAGKSQCVLDMATLLSDLIQGVLWITPRKSLERQAAETLKALPSHINWLTTNYMAVQSDPKKFRRWIAENRHVLLVADEFHHLKVPNSNVCEWGWGFVYDKLVRQGANRGVTHQLLMSGTPYRNDRWQCVQVSYGEPETYTITGRRGQQLQRQRQLLQPDIIYSRQDALDEEAIVPLRVHFLDGNVEFEHVSGQYSAPLSTFGSEPETERVVAYALRSFLNTKSAWMKCLRYALKHWASNKGTHRSQVLITATSIAQAVTFAEAFYNHREEWGMPNSIAGIAVSDGHLPHDAPSDPGPLLEIGDPNQPERESLVQDYYHKQFQWRVRLLKDHVVTTNGMPDSEEAIELFRRRDIEILITVGKAYEGLDAPGCTHLIHLGINRSMPWLQQCFARAWRRDYDLSAPPYRQQYAEIFIPADIRALQVIARIHEEDDRHLHQTKTTKYVEPLTPEQVEYYSQFFGDLGDIPRGGGGQRPVAQSALVEQVTVWNERSLLSQVVDLSQEP